jgi:predicted permease
MDPTTLLSLYLISYSILQWGVAGWLLSPAPSSLITMPATLVEESCNATNRQTLDSDHDVDELASLSISQHRMYDCSSSFSSESVSARIRPFQRKYSDYPSTDDSSFYSLYYTLILYIQNLYSTMKKIIHTILVHLAQVLQHSIQPPVIASILGMIISSIQPLRGLFVEVEGLPSAMSRRHPPLLSWLFDGLVDIGQAAVPINMMILGMNISTSFFDKKKKYVASSFFYPDSNNTVLNNMPEEENQTHHRPLQGEPVDSVSKLSYQTIVVAVLGKMLCMPMIGIISTFIFHKVFGDLIPQGTLYMLLL